MDINYHEGEKTLITLIANNVREIRRSLNLKVEDVCEELNLFETYYRLIELGYVKPDFNDLVRISKLFNVTVDQLMRDRSYTRAARNGFFVIDPDDAATYN